MKTNNLSKTPYNLITHGNFQSKRSLTTQLVAINLILNNITWMYLWGSLNVMG